MESALGATEAAEGEEIKSQVRVRMIWCGRLGVSVLRLCGKVLKDPRVFRWFVLGDVLLLAMPKVFEAFQGPINLMFDF